MTVPNRPVVRVKRNHSTHTFCPFVLHTSPLNEREVVIRGETTQSRSAVALRTLPVKCGSISMAHRSVKRYTAIPPRHLIALDLLSTHCRNKYPMPKRPITNVILKLLYWQPGWRKQSQGRSGTFLSSPSPEVLSGPATFQSTAYREIYFNGLWQKLNNYMPHIILLNIIHCLLYIWYTRHFRSRSF